MTNYEKVKQRSRGMIAGEILVEYDYGCIDYRKLDDFIFHYIIEPEYGSLDENLLILQDLSYYFDVIGCEEMKSILLDNVYYYLKENEFFADDTFFRNCFIAGKAFNLWNSRIQMINVLLNY